MNMLSTAAFQNNTDTAAPFATQDVFVRARMQANGKIVFAGQDGDWVSPGPIHRAYVLPNASDWKWALRGTDRPGAFIVRVRMALHPHTPYSSQTATSGAPDLFPTQEDDVAVARPVDKHGHFISAGARLVIAHAQNGSEREPHRLTEDLYAAVSCDFTSQQANNLVSYEDIATAPRVDITKTPGWIASGAVGFRYVGMRRRISFTRFYAPHRFRAPGESIGIDAPIVTQDMPFGAPGNECFYAYTDNAGRFLCALENNLYWGTQMENALRGKTARKLRDCAHKRPQGPDFLRTARICNVHVSTHALPVPPHAVARTEGLTIVGACQGRTVYFGPHGNTLKLSKASGYAAKSETDLAQQRPGWPRMRHIVITPVAPRA